VGSVNLSQPLGRAARFCARAALLLRLIAVVLGIQLSGVGHAMADAVAAMAEHAAEHGDPCPPNGPCDDCPVGCPNCHCPNAFRSGLPLSEAELTEPILPAFLVTWSEAHAPQSPDPKLPFRPPRADLQSLSIES
jgi:hypothetical protein